MTVETAPKVRIGPDRRRVLIHCQYVFGLGHFVRTVELAGRLAESFEVMVINGGESVPNFSIPKGVEWKQLPAIYKDESSGKLVPLERSSSLTQCLRQRKELIDWFVSEFPPDVLITEHFPFGLLFKDEVLHLIRCAKGESRRCKVISSVRDIVENIGGNENDALICNLLNEHFDLVLVHGDESVVPFCTSFSMSSSVVVPFRYTGYIVGEFLLDAAKPTPPIILASVGGGRLGVELLDAVLKAHPYVLECLNHDLVIFQGAFQSGGCTLESSICPWLSGRVKIHNFDRDRYKETLARASLLICLGGYNSVLEAIACGVPVLVYQREFAGGIQEQECRIRFFQEAGLIESFQTADLTPDRLAPHIVAQLSCPMKVRPHSLQIEGLEASCRIVASLFNPSSTGSRGETDP